MKTYNKEDLKNKKNREDLKKRYYESLNDYDGEDEDNDEYYKSKKYYNTLNESDKTKAAYYSQNTPEVNAEKEKNRQESERRENSNKVSDKIKTKVEELKERAAVASYGADNYKKTYNKNKNNGSW